jgi:hypothetical protein
LGGEEAIEGVAMMKWEQAGTDGVQRVDADRREALIFQHLMKIGKKYVGNLLVLVGLD